ncbi:hypothetical protein GCM10023194_39230 [Planotetraspora phitsanulokensis]|uniref:Uncharacterized protein n=1 Tax=Planotetraspora phitsanulokensis TaxID=575192 RepID=A0A8J3UMQ8_9ACTN|nr:hypothetical protein [Planotetraspora phitsanulokensis]GII41550.1 hypothetical protein Pph01_65530 [Planotetraspora phitsanulokensis]
MLLSLTPACGGSGGEERQQQPAAEAGAVTVTMWTRAATQAQSERLVEAYSRPALIIVGPFAFLASWNDFFAPLILLDDGASTTLPVAVVSMTQNMFGAIDYGMLPPAVPPPGQPRSRHHAGLAAPRDRSRVLRGNAVRLVRV